MTFTDQVASNLAAALLAGPWSVEEMTRRAALAWGRRKRWLHPFVRRVLRAFLPVPPLPSATTLTAFLLGDTGFRRAWDASRRGARLPLGQFFWVESTMDPAPGVPGSWDLPHLTSAGQLAEWLGVTPPELDWFAGTKRGRTSEDGPLHHYTYRWLTGRRGKRRLLEIPKARLKALQRRLLRDLLDRIPPHDAAHGYRRGRSVLTYLAPHTGRRVVLHLDLRQFFPSVPASRVHALFRTAGYPDDVARLLTGLCTNAVPTEVARAGRPETGRPPAENEQRLRSPHLPQGAPTSPALANLCAYRLDCRLHGLAGSVGAGYTRYADDLVFSGGERLEACRRRFHVTVCRLALEEGFEVNSRKSRFLHQGVRQQVGGVVVNAHLNLRRDDFDQLKATLTNCLRHGPHGQNREGRADFRAHLAGRIAHLAQFHPSRGRRLRDLFDRIRWDEGGG
jgi:hypothetical protein